jgi:hypothetical protein
MRMAMCWTAVLTMWMAGVARAQDVPAGATAPATPPPATTPPATTPPATTPSVTPPSERWTVDSGNTVGPGANVFAGAVGYPGLDLRLLHGLDANTDVNARIGINYAFEGITRGSRFEFTAQVGIRKELTVLGNNMKLAGTFDPGIIVASSPGEFGLKIPLGLQLGIPISHELMLNASFDLPLFFTFGDFSAFYIPLLFGGGAEYLVQPNLAITGKLKIGPTFGTNGFPTSFTLYVLVGAAYKF